MSKNRLKKHGKFLFDPSRHDRRVDAANTATTKNELERNQRRIKQYLKDLYDRWKRNTLKSPPTPDSLIKSLEALAVKFRAVEPDAIRFKLNNYYREALTMLDDKLVKLRASEAGKSNLFTVYIPEFPTPLDPGNNEIVREQMIKDRVSIPFQTLEELKAIPAVVKFMTEPGFIGLALHGQWLIGLLSLIHI